MAKQEWTRPALIPFPSRWHEFEGKKVENGKRRKYWVQDMTDDYRDEVLHNLRVGFLRDEPICKYSNYNEESIEEAVQFWADMMKQRLTIICLTEDENGGKPKLAGFNCLVIGEENEEPPIITTPQLNQTLSLLMYVSHHRNPFKHLGITEYLSAMGLYVLPEFRGESLGMEILNAREPICRAFGFKATITVFTSCISQKLAEKCGFVDLFSISYEELGNINPLFKIVGIEKHTKICKYMYKLYKS